MHGATQGKVPGAGGDVTPRRVSAALQHDGQARRSHSPWIRDSSWPHGESHRRGVARDQRPHKEGYLCPTQRGMKGHNTADDGANGGHGCCPMTPKRAARGDARNALDRKGMDVNNPPPPSSNRP
jgi:hypothetical protein